MPDQHKFPSHANCLSCGKALEGRDERADGLCTNPIPPDYNSYNSCFGVVTRWARKKGLYKDGEGIIIPSSHWTVAIDMWVNEGKPGVPDEWKDHA